MWDTHIYIYVYIHTHFFICVYIYTLFRSQLRRLCVSRHHGLMIQRDIWTCICIGIYLYMNIYLHLNMYISKSISMFIYVRAPPSAPTLRRSPSRPKEQRKQRWMYICIDLYMHAYIHTTYTYIYIYILIPISIYIRAPPSAPTLRRSSYPFIRPIGLTHGLSRKEIYVHIYECVYECVYG